MMERNFKVIEKAGKFYIQYEYWSNIFDKWKKAIFKDLNRDDLYFLREFDAKTWIEARELLISF